MASLGIYCYCISINFWG